MLRSVLIGVIMAITQLHCGSGPHIDTLASASLTAGASHTLTLKFWMKERGLKGDELVPNLHFDDGANARAVFWIGPGVNADTLEQGKAYKVTFTYDAGDPLVKGTATTIE